MFAKQNYCLVPTIKYRTHPSIPLKIRHFRSSVCSVWDKGYRFGFNSMEKDNEINVNGGSYDFGARIYDSRLGRWLSLDPLMGEYVSQSPYSFAYNSPISFIDPDGKEVILGITTAFCRNSLSVIQRSEVVSNFINQFAIKTLGPTTNPTNGSQGFYNNLQAKQKTGKYANDFTLSINDAPRKSPEGKTMIENSQDAQTTFLYTLSNGTVIAANLYTPTEGVTVNKVQINIVVLEGLNPSNETIENMKAVSGALISNLIVNELYTNVDNFMNIVNINTDPTTGKIDYTAVSIAYNTFLSGGTPAPASPQLPNAQNNIIEKNSGQSCGFIQYDILDKGTNSVTCRNTTTTGQFFEFQLKSPSKLFTSDASGIVFPLIKNPSGTSSNGDNSEIRATPKEDRNPYSNSCQ